jgi:hypothetical protein
MVALLPILHRWSGHLLALLGLAHTSLAVPTLLRRPDAETVWFAGTGLALLLLVFLNVAFRRWPHDAIVRRLCHGSNVAFSLFGGAAVLAVPEPQAYAVFLFILAQTLSAFGSMPKERDSSGSRSPAT